MKVAFLCVLLAGCRLYDPMPLDCRVSCGVDDLCPEQTTCRDGLCRTAGSTGLCECREGEEQPCGSDLGVCEPGVQQCNGTQWGACEGAVPGSAESCNGLDDDCDGAVDEAIALPPPCARTLGVCLAASQQCLGGAWQACDAQTYGRSFEPLEVSCDGLDNDCDGLVDSHAIVELASGNIGPWFFLTTAQGFALVSTTDSGVELRWLSKSLARVALHQATQTSLATSRGDTLILTTKTDAGVLISDFEADGGNSARTVQSWLDPAALDVSVDFAAASVNGEVQLLSLLDGGAPVRLGPDTDGVLRLGHAGQSLAWSGGLTRTTDLTLLRGIQIEPLLALMDLKFTIAGVPFAQPSQPLFFADLTSLAPARRLSTFTVPPLFGIQATEHRDRVLLTGIEPPNALWVVNEGGTHRRVILGGLTSVRVTPSHAPLAAFAWEKDGIIWGVRRCAP